MIPKIIVTEDQWIQKGMEQFARNGVDGLVIEKMASELSCSKSSFYWYFKNRSEFLSRLIDRWCEITTRQVIHQSSVTEQAEEQLKVMLVAMFSTTQKGDFLFYLRKLADDHPEFHNILESIEFTRMQYAKELLTKFGMPPEAAEEKSCMLYHYYLGWYERYKRTEIGHEELMRHIHRIRTHLLGV